MSTMDDIKKLQSTTRRLATTLAAAAEMADATGRGAQIELLRLLDDAVTILNELVELDPDPHMKGAYRSEQRGLRKLPSRARLEELAVDYAELAGCDPRNDLASDVFVQAICWADVCLTCGADKVSTHCVLCGTNHTVLA